MRETSYGFDDVFLVPRYSERRHRKDNDTSTDVLGVKLDMPVITSNMDRVTGEKMAITMWKNGAIGALHRRWSVEDNVVAYRNIKEAGADCFVTVGVASSNEERRLHELCGTYGAKYVNIDIAHGHCIMMKEMIEYIRAHYPDAYIAAGNVATAEGAADLSIWGANAIKVGIAGGSVCDTRNITGHGMPMFSSIMECAVAGEAYGTAIIADGGIRGSGDIMKALTAGADLVMCGSVFSGTEESPGDIIMVDGHPFKEYRGMSSNDVNVEARGEDADLPAPEGISTMVPYKGSAVKVLHSLKKGVQSGMSYCAASKLSEINTNARWRVQTVAGKIEGMPHITLGK